MPTRFMGILVFVFVLMVVITAIASVMAFSISVAIAVSITIGTVSATDFLFIGSDHGDDGTDDVEMFLEKRIDTGGDFLLLRDVLSADEEITVDHLS